MVVLRYEKLVSLRSRMGVGFMLPASISSDVWHWIGRDWIVGCYIPADSGIAIFKKSFVILLNSF